MPRIRIELKNDKVNVIEGSLGYFEIAVAHAGEKCPDCDEQLDVVTEYQDDQHGYSRQECSNCHYLGGPPEMTVTSHGQVYTAKV